MKIACVQFAPRLGEVQRNMDHATAMVAAKFDAGELDPSPSDLGEVVWLVLPEMAFTGTDSRLKAIGAPMA